MNNNFRVFLSIEEWNNAGKPIDSYIKEDCNFDFICKICGQKATLFCEYEFQYGIQRVIHCQCGNESEFYGVDG